jgi:hypothetical protein
MVQCLGYFACFSFFFYMKMYVMSRKDENCFHESFEMQIFIDSTLIYSFIPCWPCDGPPSCFSFSWGA